jgi:malonyl-CoA/methylmalonyl-CoA synthetase
MGAAHPVLLPALGKQGDREAIRFGQRALDYRELRGAAARVARRLEGERRVAVWARPELETCVAVVGALSAGVPIIPINPKSGRRELGHLVNDGAPSLVLAAPGDELPSALEAVPRLDLDLDAEADDEPLLPAEPDPQSPALVIYTSGTTGPPKGVVLAHRAIAATLDALGDAWEWTELDVLAHGLPLFHVHGLVLGVLGPLRRGGTLHHLGSFSTDAAASELAGPATMLFGVPTMYHRLADAAEADPAVARALAGARLLVSGSAALSTTDHERIERSTGQRVVERYGMTETLITCSVRADGDRRPGTVGPPLAGVEVRLVDDDGQTIEASDDRTVGEILVRGPNLFTEYLNRPAATAEAFDEDWFCTGDVATREPDGNISLIGRREADLIKSGGFKIGAGEIEVALVEHPGIQDAAITAEPDPDLGERIVAWIVPAAQPPPSEQEVADHVAQLLTPHKRPRVVHYLESLPRNDMGKVMKKSLSAPRAD